MMKAAEARSKVTLKNILFATDFSDAATAAASIAVQIAQRYGAKVYGVHVNKFENYSAVAPQNWAALAEAEVRERNEDTERLNEQLMSVEHEAIVTEGNTWEEVSKVIQEKGIDLIVLGTRGRTGLGRALLGSAAEEILHQAPCPVLTVGPHINLWSEEYGKMKEILFATDLASDHPAAAPYAVSLAQENEAHLVFLHVIENAKSNELKEAEKKERKLERLVPPGAELACEPAYIVEHGPAAEKILDVARRRHTDMIVLGARPAGWLATHFNAGTVHQVVAEATCPVLTIRG
jgi:nucleotide-binding universal stress UspA family protein